MTGLLDFSGFWCVFVDMSGWHVVIQDWIFGVVYVIEILVRIAGTKWAFFCDLSNLFDASLVLLWMCELTLSHYLYVDAALVRSSAQGLHNGSIPCRASTPCPDQHDQPTFQGRISSKHLQTSPNISKPESQSLSIL